jgi:competence protein ComFC
MFSNYPQRISSWLSDLIFPIRCIGCRKFGDYICRGCLGAISIKKTFECIGCKRSTPLGQTCFLCAKTNSVDQLLIIADYKNPLVEKSLKFLKYRFISDLERPLLVLIKKYLKWLTLDKKFNVFGVNPLLIPVPLHSRRLNWRGFNQSELLAKNLADTFQMEMAGDVIERTINATPQADIKERDKRLKNLRGIFKVLNKDKIVGREVLLVDDICTTGATLNECAKVLKENGTGRVIALVVARG